MQSPDMLRAAVGVLVGAGIGWAANALTLAGRVEAIEQGQARIEQRLDLLITKKEQHAQRP